MVKRFLSSLAMGLILCGCASTPEIFGGADKAKTEKPTDRLEARHLAQGECAIFVWTKDNARRFILFSQYKEPMASWWSGNGEGEGEIMITRTLSEGYSSYEQPPHQDFVLPGGGRLSLKLDDPEEINHGTRYKTGSITIKSADDWEKVIPVIGLAGCQISQG